MVDGTSQATGDEPGAGPQESQSANGVQPGGITPKVAEALAGLDPASRAIVEEDIRQRNRYLTSERQRLAQDVQLGNALKALLKDSQFQKYMHARESGDVVTFFRSELEASGQLRDLTEPENNSMDPGDPADPEEAGDTTMTPNREVQELQARLAQLEQQSVAERQQRELDAFVANHSDWEDHLPAMQKIRAEYPDLDLERTYRLAKLDVQQGLATLAAEESPQQQAAASTAETSDTSTPDIDSGRDAAGTTVKTGKRDAFTQAWDQAKKNLGLEGEVKVQFS